MAMEINIGQEDTGQEDQGQEDCRTGVQDGPRAAVAWEWWRQNDTLKG